MVLLDDRILEHLTHVETSTPTKLSEEDNIVHSRQQVSNRLNKLADHGLVKDLGNGVYRITDRGIGYLEGEINTSEDMPDEVPSANGENAAGTNDNHEQV